MTAAIPRSMAAWRYTSASGGLDKAIRLEHTSPNPTASKALANGEVLVKIAAMSLNPGDIVMPELGFVSRVMVSSPASPGMDYAGHVAAVGSAIAEKFTIGQEVFGRIYPGSGFGTLAEYAVVKNTAQIAVVPVGLQGKLQDAACIGTAGITAYQSIAPYVQPGDRVFINGGSGGTGTFGIQIAKVLGCHVTTSCSTRNIELCRSLGADEVVDYSTQNVCETLQSLFETAGKPYKLIVDNVGASPPELHKAADGFLASDGLFLQIGGKVSWQDTKVLLGRVLLPTWLGGGRSRFSFPMTKESQTDMVRIAKWIEQGKIKVVKDEVFRFEDAPNAIRKLKSGRARGKIVVDIAS